jgi:hypothetical protein
LALVDVKLAMDQLNPGDYNKWIRLLHAYVAGALWVASEAKRYALIANKFIEALI